MTRDLNQLAAEVHEANSKWWHDLNTGEPITRNKGELLMLMVSELAEAMEGERKGLKDDKLPHRPMAEVEMADVVIRALDYAGGFGHKFPEIKFNFLVPANKAEALLCIGGIIWELYELEIINRQSPGVPYRLGALIKAVEDYCDYHGYDLWGAVAEKMNFNRTRVDHTLEARRAAGGKKW